MIWCTLPPLTPPSPRKRGEGVFDASFAPFSALKLAFEMLSPRYGIGLNSPELGMGEIPV